MFITHTFHHLPQQHQDEAPSRSLNPVYRALIGWLFQSCQWTQHHSILSCCKHWKYSEHPFIRSFLKVRPDPPDWPHPLRWNRIWISHLNRSGGSLALTAWFFSSLSTLLPFSVCQQRLCLLLSHGIAREAWEKGKSYHFTLVCYHGNQPTVKTLRWWWTGKGFVSDSLLSTPLFSWSSVFICLPSSPLPTIL